MPTDTKQPMIHHVSCTAHSAVLGTAEFDQVQAKAERLRKYAEKLGFAVFYENADQRWS